MLNLSKKEKAVFLKTFRQTIYFILMFSFVFVIHFIADTYKEKTFDEHSIIENIQLTFLITSGVLFLLEGILYKKYRVVLFLLTSLSFLASFRELDLYLDRNLPIVGWKIGYIIPISAIIYAIKNKRNLRNTLIDFYASSSFYMMCCALIIILPIAQCIGHGPFVRDVMGNFRVADIKELFEESGEIMGYFLLVLSSIEFYLGLLRKEK
jgi:hypothetical protein